MDFLADESCAAPVTQALRAAGHDVVAIAESEPGASDEQALAPANADARAERCLAVLEEGKAS